MLQTAMLDVRKHLLRGWVIPAHPLALTCDRRLDVARQQALTRYYCAAGAGGIAVGVHTTQFEIHEPKSGLLRPALELASETANESTGLPGRRFAMIAGICGSRLQAVREAALARSLGYHAGLLSLGTLPDASEDQLLDHCRAVAEVIPLFGFYLQPSVGGRELGYRFWRQFVEIPQVVAIKIAPFDRYRTVDVVRAVWETGRSKEIALYTGNDDNIIADLVTPYDFGDGMPLRIVGGLLGQWAVWTRTAVRLLGEIKSMNGSTGSGYAELLALGVQLTDCNAAIFDAAHAYRGCLPGIHEILRREGLMNGRWCLDASLDLSPGQEQEIDRVCHMYPHLGDFEFVAAHLDEWLR